MTVCHDIGASLDGGEVRHKAHAKRTEHSLTTRDCTEYVPGAQQGLTPNVIPEGAKTCAMFGGGCNGICGIEDNDANFKRHAGCARVV